MSEGILSTEDLETIIQKYEETKLEDISTEVFFKKCALLFKVEQVATLEVTLGMNERIKEFMSKCRKVDCLIKDLITVSVWKEKVLPELLNLKPIPKNSLPTYIVLYYETVLVGLLLILLYHPIMFLDIPESSCIDLIDYCAFQLFKLVQDRTSNNNEIKTNTTAIEDIENHHRKLSFIIRTQCISLLRLICENLDDLPLGVASRMYTTHDLPMLIVNLLENDTWSKNVDGKLYKFYDYKWNLTLSDDGALTKTEIQVWLLMHQMQLHPISKTLYSLNAYRKDQLSKLLKYLHDGVTDQLSPLNDLKKWILTKSLYVDDPGANNPLILEITTTYREIIYAEYKSKWLDIALSNSRLLFYPNEIELMNIAKTFSDFIDNLETVTQESKTCASCFNKAMKKCSKCKKAWYCSRKCQIDHWPSHKKLCQ